jgi:hypothetical protein
MAKCSRDSMLLCTKFKCSGYYIFQGEGAKIILLSLLLNLAWNIGMEDAIERLDDLTYICALTMFKKLADGLKRHTACCNWGS